MEPTEVLQHPDRLIAFLFAIDGERHTAGEGEILLKDWLDDATEANLTTLPSIPFDTKTKQHNGTLDAKRVYDAAYGLTGMTSNARRIMSGLAEGHAQVVAERVADELARATAETEARRGSDGI